MSLNCVKLLKNNSTRHFTQAQGRDQEVAEACNRLIKTVSSAGTIAPGSIESLSRLRAGCAAALHATETFDGAPCLAHPG
jgi:uncharacterized protein related to proFAR isomerase